MKKLLFLSIILFSFSCGDENKTIENQNTLTELKNFEALKATEENTKQFIEDYLRDVNSSDWKSKLPKYLQAGAETDSFLEEHTVFRTSFSNYKSTIKHLAVDGNEGIVWINVTANYAETYRFDHSVYGDEIVNGIEAKGQALSWDETWYFDEVDGKFGAEWDFLKDNHKVLEDLKSAEFP